MDTSHITVGYLAGEGSNGGLGSRHLGEDRILRIISEENTEAVISELSYEIK